MVIAHMSGGFGNQLYSYAFGYSLAKERGEEFWIDTALQDQKWFFRNPDIMKMNIDYDKRLSYKIGRSIFDRAFFNKLRFRKAIGFGTTIIRESEIPKNQDWFEYCLNTKGNIYVQGNWSYERFFIKYIDDIKDRFTFKTELGQGAKSLLKEIEASENSVGVHYRRGDYVKIGISMKPGYFIDSMEEMSNRLVNPTFFVFSEDLDYVREQFKDLPYSIKYCRYESEDAGIEDFRLFSSCKHQINSNSSFSWWGAYLNDYADKVVIAPTDYTGGWKKEIYPKDWILKTFEMIGR